MSRNLGGRYRRPIARLLLLAAGVAGSVAVTVAVLALWFRSALLWYRAARAMRARPSFRRVTAIGLVLVPCTMAATLVALMASPGPT